MNAGMQGSGPRILRPAWRARLLPAAVCLLLIGFLGFRAGPLITSVSGTLGGSGMATAGWVLGIVGMAFLVIWILVVILNIVLGASAARSGG